MGPYAVVWMPGLAESPHDREGVAAALGPAFQVVTEPPGDGAVAVVGHSFGCLPALRFAADHPAAVDAVVLTSGFYPPARDGRSLASTMADYGQHRMAYARELARRGRAPRPTTGAARRLASLARLGIHPRAFHELADRVRCPVLVVHGAADHVVPVAFARAAAARHPAWTYDEVPDAGHYLHRDAPAAWAEIVRIWLTPRTSRH
jgi:pimeloyl-ACP methyl ester carboxylesterase